MLLTPAEKLKGLTFAAAFTKVAAPLHVVSLDVALTLTRLALSRRGGTTVLNQIVTWEHTWIHSARLCLCVRFCGGGFVWRVSPYLADTCYSRSFVHHDCWDIVFHCTLRNAAKVRNTRKWLQGSRVAASEERTEERLMRETQQTRSRNNKGLWWWSSVTFLQKFKRNAQMCTQGSCCKLTLKIPTADLIYTSMFHMTEYLPY